MPTLDQPLRVLLVEDNPGDARLVQELLKEAALPSLELHVTDSLSGARQALASARPDVALLDLNLPDSSGLTTVETFLEASPDVPVVVLTGLGDAEVGVGALQAGAQDYLTKDGLTGELIARSIRYALERSAREAEQREMTATEHYLSEAGQTLAASLVARDTLRGLGDLIVPTLADWSVVELMDGPSAPEVQVTASDEAMETRLRAAFCNGESGGRGLSRQLGTDGPRRGGPLPYWLPQEPESAPDHLLSEIGATAAVFAPMIARARRIGTLLVGMASPERVMSDRQRMLVRELGSRAALALDNAGLHEEVREARDRAEDAVSRIRAMADLTASLAAALTPRQVAEVIIEHLRVRAGVTGAVFHLFDAERNELELVAAEALPDDRLAPWTRVPLDAAGPLTEAAGSGWVVVRPDEWRDRYPDLADPFGMKRPLVAVPLRAEAGLLGTMMIEVAEPDDVGSDTGILDCAGNCALAMQRAVLFAAERRAREDAERATRARDDVLSVVAHDLRNPLGAVGNYAALLGIATNVEQRERYLAGISTATHLMDRLIQDLLDVARLESGRLGMDIRREAVRAIFPEAVGATGGQAERLGVTVVAPALEGLPDVAMDRERILQVLGNLIGNGIRFTPEGGRITLQAERVGDEVMFLVSDTGPGILPEHVPHVFDRFWQAPGEAKSGAGLGLAIAKGIVEAHGGRIGVESVPGEGSTFFFTLPVSDAPQPGERAPAVPLMDAPPEEEPPEEEPASVIRVMLVDDHAALRRGVGELLRREPGIEVVAEARTGEEALEETRIRRPDVVLMDLAMPGIGGLEAIRQITVRHPGARVLVLTAEAEEDALLPALEAGAMGFVRKTTAHEDLPLALRTVARGEVFLYPSGNRLLLRDYLAAAEHQARLAELSKEERAILALAAEGFNSTEIGKKLFLSPKTVDSYRSRATRALGLASRAELVRFALSAGLLVAPAQK